MSGVIGIGRIEAKSAVPKWLNRKRTRRLCHLASSSSSSPRSDSLDSYTSAPGNGTIRQRWQLTAPVIQQRSFSATASSLESYEGSSSQSRDFKEETAREWTRYFCNYSSQIVGSMTEKEWRDATSLVHFWTRLETEEAVEASLALLDRLLAEQFAIVEADKEHNKLIELSKEVFTTDLLNDILRQWNICWKTNKTKFPPQTMYEEIVERNKSPSLVPSTKSCNFILDAGSKRYPPTKSIQFAQYVFDKMAKSAPQPQPLTAKNNLKGESSKIQSTRSFPSAMVGIRPDVATWTILINIHAKAGDAEAAEDLLNRMNNDYLSGKSSVQPNVKTFTTAISAWTRSGAPDAPEKAETILELMHQYDKNKSLGNVRPNLVTYNALLGVIARSKRDDAGTKAEEILKRMETFSYLQPDDVSYKMVINAYLLGPNNLEGAEAVLRRQIVAFKFMDNVNARPNADSFLRVLEALHKASVDDENAPFKAERLLKHMLELKVQPTKSIYNLVLGCWAKSNHERAGGRAELILHEMPLPPKKSIKYPFKPVQPDNASYNYVISAYANAGKSESAEMVFRAMYNEYQNGNKSVRPTRRTFNALLAAWSRSTTAADSERLKAILNIMEQIPKMVGLDIKPDVVSYNCLLGCLSRMNTDDARVRAENVLEEMERKASSENDDTIAPDKYSYTSVMKCFSKGGDVQKTRKLFDRMLEKFRNGDEKCKPDRFVFGCLLESISKNAKGRHIDAGKEADKIFKQMNEYYANGMLDKPPNKVTYDLRINCWGNSNDSRAPHRAEEILKDMQALAALGHKEFQPDARTVTSVINAHAKVGNCARAEELLRQMFEEYTNGNKEMKPTLETINIVLASLARSKEPGAARKAEVYLREMLAFQDASTIDLKPDVATFTTVITCWANSGDPMAAEHAKALFRELELLSHTDDAIRLDAGIYRSMLRACARTGDTVYAESLLQEIVNDAGLDGAIKADRYMYHAVIQAYAASDEEDAADKAEALLREMDAIAESTDSSLVKPDKLCYLTVLECWGKSKHTKRALEHSEQLLLEMEEKARNGDDIVKPCPATYSRVINTMARAGDIGRTKKILRRIYTEGIASSVQAMVPGDI